jgi:hypothetical protein
MVCFVDSTMALIDVGLESLATWTANCAHTGCARKSPISNPMTVCAALPGFLLFIFLSASAG